MHAWDVTVPSFRKDLASEIDLVEEVARLYGYDKIPEHFDLNTFIFKTQTKPNHTEYFELQLTQILQNLNLLEVKNYSFITEKELKKYTLPEESVLKLKKTSEFSQSYLRPNLLSGLNKVLQYNFKSTRRRARHF